jgi:hypothetical protein
MNNEVDEDEIGMACRTNREKRNVYKWESQRERDH